jgi:acyl-CoA synthetase (AMP-forming)/AMP-acid ligase II
VSSISGAELEDGVRLLVEGGRGSCVGRPAPGIEIEIVPFEHVDHDHKASHHVGEISVRGEVVTHAYAEDPRATSAAKVHDAGTVWHRTGDAGYFDDDGLLWTVGRVAHRIDTSAGTRWPVPLENICDLHPRVRRTALVGAGDSGRTHTCLVIEPRSGEWPPTDSERLAFQLEMEALLRSRAHPSELASTPDRVLFHPNLPVDVRHNAKIRREEVSAWAAGQSA